MKSDMRQDVKQSYVKPELVRYGPVQALTAGGPNGTNDGAAGLALSSAPSDRALKDDFATVDRAEILARLAALPVTTWSYKADDSSIRHIGPMAQDFFAAFEVGADNRHIHMIDSAGVAFAAIQALHELVQEQAAELSELRGELSELRRGAAVAELV